MIKSTAEIPPSLKHAAMIGNCVAFVGAGFSQPVGMPTWKVLLAAIWDEAAIQPSDDARSSLLASCKSCIDAGDFLLAASDLRKLLHQGEINRVVSFQFRDTRLKECSPLARETMLRRMSALARGPYAGIITTNYDTLIERALAERGTGYISSSLNSESDLGLALHRTHRQGTFFVKIHGSINTGGVILTSEEYDNAYLKSSKIGNFLLAAMMTYNFLFLGSSVEDQLLRVRQQLCADYGGGVPVAYALMPNTEMNLRRARWLNETARVHSLFYVAGQHGALDEFLESFEALAEVREREQFPSIGHAAHIKGLGSLQAKLNAIGLVNAAIVDFIRISCKGVVSKAQLLGFKSRLSLPEQISKLSRDEIFYRVSFLVSIGLLSEAEIQDEIVFETVES